MGWWHPWPPCRGDAAGWESHQVHRLSVVGAPERQVRKGQPRVSLSMAAGLAGCCPPAVPLLSLIFSLLPVPSPGGWDGPTAPSGHTCAAAAAGWGVGRARAPCGGQCPPHSPLLPTTGAAGAKLPSINLFRYFFSSLAVCVVVGGCPRAGGAAPPPHPWGCAASGAVGLLGGDSKESSRQSSRKRGTFSADVTPKPSAEPSGTGGALPSITSGESGWFILL